MLDYIERKRGIKRSARQIRGSENIVHRKSDRPFGIGPAFGIFDK
jgi:hypothetical protein